MTSEAKTLTAVAVIIILIMAFVSVADVQVDGGFELPHIETSSGISSEDDNIVGHENTADNDVLP